MERLFLSFCLPCYNVANYIEECIESIVSQGLPSYSYEILCCDDSSSDETLSTIKKIADIYPNVRIKWMKNEKNSGVSYSRNKLLLEAQGSYIWWIDADDALIQGIVHRFITILEQTHCDVLLGNYERCYEIPSSPRGFESNDMSFVLADMKALPTDQNGFRMCAVWCGVFRRKFLIENHLLFNENMIAQEDTLYYYEVECCSPVVYKSYAHCYYYRQHDDSVMHTRTVDRAKRYYTSMLEMLRVYKVHQSSGNYLDANILEDKIKHSEYNVVTCLSAIPDKPYVKKELRRLKNEKQYPCQFYLPILKRQFVRNLLPFLSPIPPFFWLNHYLYRVKYFIDQQL